ncbi:hypothetical protein Tco_1541671 [Tanacetum coccineum]
MAMKLKFLKLKIKEWNQRNMKYLKSGKAKLKEDLEALDADIDKGNGTADMVTKRSEVVNSLQELTNFNDGNRSISNKFAKPVDQRAHINMEYLNTITLEQQIDLECDVTKKELKKAVWDCGIDKSPGPDGFTFGVYRRFWSTIENDVFEAVKYFFNNGVIPNGCNSSFIALIPKIPDANLVKDFRPISLIGRMLRSLQKLWLNRTKVGGSMSRTHAWEEVIDKVSKWKDDGENWCTVYVKLADIALDASSSSKNPMGGKCTRMESQVDAYQRGLIVSAETAFHVKDYLNGGLPLLSKSKFLWLNDALGLRVIALPPNTNLILEEFFYVYCGGGHLWSLPETSIDLPTSIPRNSRRRRRRVGSDQKNDAFWYKIRDAYNDQAAKKGFTIRTQNMLTGKWTLMNREVGKFNSLVNETKAMRGDNDENLMTRVEILYRAHEKTDFKHKSAWNFLKGKHKWNNPESTQARRNRHRVTDPEPELFGDDALPRPPGMHRIAKSQRSSNSSASSGSNPTMFQEMMQQQLEIEQKEKMERIDREVNSRVALNDSKRVADDLKVLQISTDRMNPIDAAIVNAQKARIRALYNPNN